MKLFAKIFATAALFISCAFGASAQLPSVQLKDLSGKPVDTATLSNDGKPFIISRVLFRSQDETGVKLYAVSVDKAQDVTKVKPVVDASSWEYEVLLDPNGDFQRAMGAANVPHVVVVDGNGKIVESHSGYTEGSEDHLFEIIRELVNKK